MPPQGAHPGVVDAEACLDQVLFGAATMGGMTVVDAMDAVNSTPSPRVTPVDGCLKRFIERVTKAGQPPLLELPGDDVDHDRCAMPVLPRGASG
jgi:hypothetical protein